MTIRPLNANDVALYRSLRLAALEQDATAFGSTLERESRFDDATRAARLGSFQGRPGAVFVADESGTPVGIAGVGLSADPTVAILWGMWVDPAARRAGIAKQLLAARFAEARREGTEIIMTAPLEANR